MVMKILFVSSSRKSPTLSSVQFQDDCNIPTSLPPNTVYLCGLELRGALWDAQLGAIEAADSWQTSSMPVVCVEVKFRSPETEGESFHPGILHAENTGAVSPSSTQELSLYNCPLCVDTEQESQREQTTASDGIVATVPLQTKIPPVLCRLRRVKIISVLWLHHQAHFGAHWRNLAITAAKNCTKRRKNNKTRYLPVMNH